MISSSEKCYASKKHLINKHNLFHFILAKPLFTEDLLYVGIPRLLRQNSAMSSS
jgi:hypothetical protein